MRIHKIQDNPPDPKPLNLEVLTAELGEISKRHNLRLISFGAMAMNNTDGPGTSYLAVWATPAESTEQ
jgi:hypothetical protein